MKTLILLVLASVACAADLESGVKDKERLRLRVTELASGALTDGVGDLELRVVVSLQGYYKPKGKPVATLSPVLLGKSRKFYQATQHLEVEPSNADIEISGAALNAALRKLELEDPTKVELRVVLEEVDALSSDLVADVSVPLDGLNHSTIVAEDWQGEPRTLTYEVEVEDTSVMYVSDGNGGFTTLPVSAGSHKEKRTKQLGGGTRAKVTLQADILSK